MERIINLRIERLPKGGFLATSREVPGLVVKGDTLTETLASAREAASRIIAAREASGWLPGLQPVQDLFDYPLVIQA